MDARQKDPCQSVFTGEASAHSFGTLAGTPSQESEPVDWNVSDRYIIEEKQLKL